MSKYYYFSYDISAENQRLIEGSTKLIIIVEALTKFRAQILAENRIINRVNYTGDINDYELSLYKVDDKKVGKCYPNKKFLEYTDR